MPVALRLAALLAAVTVGACGGSDPAADRDDAPSARARVDPSVERALRDPGVRRRLERCPVTAPNFSIPPGERPRPGYPVAAYHGRGGLWTVLQPRGVLVGEKESDGSIAMKVPWWRGVRGALKITGRKLARPAGGLRAQIPSGYGSTGFQSTALIFPTEGCWKVTGRAGTAEMTFVTLVVAARPQ